MNSPKVSFTIENDNVEQFTAQLGVTAVLARTLRGPFNDPSTVITSMTQFRNLFGGEIVPNGSVSNIEKALQNGSKLRVVRVPGTGYAKGFLYNSTVSQTPSARTNTITLQVNPSGAGRATTTASIKLGFDIKTYDELIDGVPTFDVAFKKVGNTIVYTVYPTGKPETVLEQGNMITFANKNEVNPTTVVDYLQIQNFFSGSSYFEPVFMGSTGTASSVTKLSDIPAYLAKSIDGTVNDFDIQITDSYASETEIVLRSKPGSSGTTPTKEEWIASADCLRDYNEYYQVFCSHISGHLPTLADQVAVHKAIKAIAEEVEDFVYYIEIDAQNNGTPLTKAQLVSNTKNMVNSIGNSMWVAYFGGGIKYYDNYGILVDSDVLGTVVGLGDQAASVHGPWKSFAGMNRGLIYDAQGPVVANYGSPSRYNDLNELAQTYLNMVVVKNVRNSGNRTLLWHCFTSQIKNDSFRFLSVVRLVLYMKKTLRPIMESYIEEPNIWNTWKDLYLECKPILDNLVDNDAISEYTWDGDQDVSSYSELVVNNEADVRQGKYKVVLKFKEVVPMQDINVVLHIDKANNTSSVQIIND